MTIWDRKKEKKG